MIYHVNLRGFKSKKKSLSAILSQLKPSIVSLNEHGLVRNQKMKIENYTSFNRNRQDQIMGGVSISVRKDEEVFAVKVFEGENKDEVIWTRFTKFHFPINLIAVYGEQENRESKSNIEARWQRLLELIRKFEVLQETLILIGDFNKHIGEGEQGVRGNHSKVSFGGQLLRSLLETEDYVCANNLDIAVGGPFTRFDPSDPQNQSKMSCLDLAIISKKLVPYLKSLKVDAEQVFAPFRTINKTKSVFPDHFPVILEFHNLPKGRPRQKVDAFTIWNTNKEGGWDSYKMLTSNLGVFDKAFENENSSPTEVMERIERKLNKIKFNSFGKVKRRPDLPDKELRNLIATR